MEPPSRDLVLVGRSPFRTRVRDEGAAQYGDKGLLVGHRVDTGQKVTMTFVIGAASQIRPILRGSSFHLRRARWLVDAFSRWQ